MSQREEKVTVYTCDAPECPIDVIAQDGEAPAGFIGTTTFAYNGGGTTEEWFAHNASHIRKAIVAVQVANNSTNPALPKDTDSDSTSGSGPASASS